MAAQKLTDAAIVKVYGKPGCGLCEAAKDKLKKMGLKYEALNLSDFTELHDGWREDNSCEVLAAYMLLDKLPVVEINGQYMDYPSAMRQLKKRSPVMEKRATTAAEN
jgi:glutaredoxin